MEEWQPASWCQVTVGQRDPEGVWWREGSQGELHRRGEREGGEGGCRGWAGRASQAQGLLDEGQENEQGKGREKRKEGEGSGRASRCGPPPQAGSPGAGPPSEEDSQDSPPPPRDSLGDHSRETPECQPHPPLVRPILRMGVRPGEEGLGRVQQ